jgi:hypothetical protein
MIKSNGKNTSKKALVFILFLYFLPTVVSYLYVLNTGYYNGDLRDTRSHLSDSELFLNFVTYIVSVLVLFGIFKFCKTLRVTYRIDVPLIEFRLFIFFILIFDILVTIFYGVGKMGQPVYKAPIYIKVLVVVFDRFHPLLGVVLYVITSHNEKNNSFNYFFMFLLLIALNFLRFSLGILFLIFVFILIYNVGKIGQIIKKHWVLFLFFLGLMVFLPQVVSVLFSYRNSLRSGIAISDVTKVKNEQIVWQEIIFKRLFGRMSNYSNSAFILEKSDSLDRITNSLTDFAYPKECLKFFYGGFISKNEFTYSKIVETLKKGKATSNNSLLLTVQGAFIIGYK